MKSQSLFRAAMFALCSFVLLNPSANATSNYEYKPDEYVVIENGLSPDGMYSIAAHGEGDLGYDNFHLYLMDAKSGRKIGLLTEVKDVLDTKADAIGAVWSKDSHQVSIGYRVDRRVVAHIIYHIENGRAKKIKGPTKVPAR